MRNFQAAMAPDRVMRRSMALLALIVAILLTGAGIGQDRALSQSCDDPGYAEDHIIVKMKDDASEEAIQRMKDINGAGEEREFSTNSWTVDLPAGYSVPEAVELYERDPDVEYAEPDYKIYPQQQCTEEPIHLDFDLSDTPDPSRVGEKLVYTGSVKNLSNAAATDVIMRSALSHEAEIISVRFKNGSTTGTCPLTGRFSTLCQIGNLNGGESATLTMVVKPVEVGSLANIFAARAANGPDVVTDISESTTVLAPGYCTISGTENNDYLVGAAGRDVICGFGGDDLILPKNGNNIVYAGSGNDHIEGTGWGKDKLFGGSGGDTIYARDGIWRNDIAVGGPGRDSITVDRGDRKRN